MPKKPAKHEPVLLPPSGDRTPVKQGWIWFGLLVLGVVLAFWRDAAFNPTVQQKIQVERIHKVQEHEEKRKKLEAQNAKIETTKGNLKAGK